jgi:hypothetical protein
MAKAASASKKPKVTVRASSAYVAYHCAASVKLCGEAPERVSGEAAAMGTEAHKWFARIVREERLDGLPEGSSDPDVVRLRYLVFTFLRMWKNGDPENGVPPLEGFANGERVVEEFVERGGVTGHPDLMTFCKATGTLVVMDWKTGRSEAVDHWLQLAAYAWLGMGRDGWDKPAKVYGVLAMVGNGEWEAREISVASALQVGERLSEHARLASRRAGRRKAGSEMEGYTLGDHCRYCKGANVCPAVSRDLVPFSAMDPDVVMRSVLAMSREEFVEADRRARVAESLLEEFKKARKAYVYASGGLVPTTGDKALVAVTETRKEVDSVGFLEHVLGVQAGPDGKGLDELGVGDYVTVSLPGYQKACVELARLAAPEGKLAKGEVGEIKDGALARLMDHGLIQETVIEKVVERRGVLALEGETAKEKTDG